ncbi:acyltransferase family protein [Microbacterium aoyamense]|uniref:Acyltransferase family protein n=1 Tax=Microbacterium aoyamense TaxID=344166 RepID=A0ABP5B3A6_9MICO|nr:acyltransferase family protein [Microbacterium aoyamense]
MTSRPAAPPPLREAEKSGVPGRRYAGLDGLRAIAVALVVGYHLFPPSVFPGGFVGVDVFFVISGFLITTLLLREHAATGGIRLGAFWIRRARRLLPALALVVTVCASAAWLIGGDVLLRVGEQVLGAFTFSYNWLSIAGNADYFGLAAPELFRNFWSLAVEEQFYVIWPLVLPLFLLIPRTWGRVGATLLLAAASATWMASVTSSGAVTRGYFGTDTHAFGILLGVGLAFALEQVLRSAALRAEPPILLAGGWRVVTLVHDTTAQRRTRRVTGVIGALALIGLFVVAFVPATPTAATFPGMLVAASVLSAVAITAGVWPGSAFGPAIDRPLLRWIGDRSYGIYLWHWPLLVLVVAGVQGTGPEVGFAPLLGVAVLAMTLALAEVSYRWVEAPIRRLGFRGAARALGRRLKGSPDARLGALATLAATLMVAGGTSAAIASAPEMGSAEAVVTAGAEALESAAPEATATPSPAPTEAPATDPVDEVIPAVVTGDQISAVGDSVMLASAPALLARYPGIQIDAAVSRSTYAGPGILENLAAAGALRPYVVIALGTNGPVNIPSLERMVAVAGPDRTVLLVNAYAPRSWIPGVNADLAAFAQTHPRVRVVDWAGAIGAQPQLLAGDQIHPGDAGGRVFADAVASTIDAIELQRAQIQHDLAERLYRSSREKVTQIQ